MRPSLALAFTEAEVRRLQGALPWQQQPGYTVGWLDAAAARHVEPRIPDEILGALSIEGTADVPDREEPARAGRLRTGAVRRDAALSVAVAPTWASDAGSRGR